jgi:hypothetical protein
MIGFAGDFTLLQTEGQNAKENGYEAQNQDPGRQHQTQPQRHGSSDRSIFLRRHKVLVRDCRNAWGTEFHAVAARKGESNETADSSQGWTSRLEPQHDCSLTLKGHVPIPRSEVMPQKYPTSEPKGES